MSPVAESDVLMKARHLISDRTNWLQHEYARTTGNKKTSCFCALAALDYAHFDMSYARIPRTVTEDYLIRAMYPESPQIRSIANQHPIACFNDTHTHSEVLAAFDRAIDLAKQTRG